VHQDTVFGCARYEALETEQILVSNMVISKETILTQGYEIPLNAFRLFGVSRRNRVPYNWSILRFGSNWS